MAHDEQFKDPEDRSDIRVKRFDYPMAGESYWDRRTLSIRVADRTLDEKYLIVEKVG
jgi:hypothetical protein